MFVKFMVTFNFNKTFALNTFYHKQNKDIKFEPKTSKKLNSMTAGGINFIPIFNINLP